MDTPTQLFQQYITRVGGRAEAAKRLPINVGMISHIVCGRRGISVPVAQAIDGDTGGTISKESLRPDVWGEQTKGG